MNIREIHSPDASGAFPTAAVEGCISLLCMESLHGEPTGWHVVARFDAASGMVRGCAVEAFRALRSSYGSTRTRAVNGSGAPILEPLCYLGDARGEPIGDTRYPNVEAAVLNIPRECRETGYRPDQVAVFWETYHMVWVRAAEGFYL